MEARRDLILKLSRIIEKNKELPEALQILCACLREDIPHFNWVGFYFMDQAREQLHLGPFSGASTEHKRIKVGEGICGQVAESGQSYRVDDVSAESNYLACSVETRSELVVPLYLQSNLLGQIDIDSHSPAAFTIDDEQLLTDLNKIIAVQYGEELSAYAQELTQAP